MFRRPWNRAKLALHSHFADRGPTAEVCGSRRSGIRPSRKAALRRLLFEQTEDRLVMAGGPLIISEFMAQNDTTLPDQDGAFSDWIEIRNTTAAAVDLTGWHLTDNAANLAKWTFPTQSLAAGGYLVVFASSKDRAVAGAELHTNFALGVNGEYLALVKPDNSISTEFTPTFPAQVADVSYGYSVDESTLGYFATPTPGAANGVPVGDVPPKVLISEIMYHPSSNNDLQEWFELYNRGATSIDLNGWQIDRGVTFTFPNVSIAAGARLVVAANTAAFSALHPGVTNVVGGWIGALADKGEEIRLLNPSGSTIDSVSYSDEGAWGTRTRGPLDNNHQGWDWVSTADGLGKSLELVNSNLSNNHGQNWLPSLADGGSPGVANAVASANIAPLVIDVSQTPKIPRSTDTVTVTAQILDELATGVSATVQYRVDGQVNFIGVAMLDDGLHGDGAAGDRVFGATLPLQSNGTVVEYYVRATDTAAQVRTWPAPVQPTNTQSANLLYQVDNTYDPLVAWTPGSQPIYRLIMTEAERAELAFIGSQNPDAQSNARMNATFIAVDGTGISSSYLVGVRNRGHGSRVGTPNNYHLDFPHDDTWNGLTGVKVNARYTDSQTIGGAVFQQADLVAGDASPVQVRVNAQNLAQAGDIMFGSYVLVEEENGDFVDKHFATNAKGNLYSAFRLDDGTQEADLRYEGADPAAYQDTYQKQSNQEENDWSDLIQMTDTLNNAPAATYFQEVSQVVDVGQWARFLALNTLLNNRESGLNTGVGDDFIMYRGVSDPRFQLLPHDLDSLMGRGNSGGSASDSIFAYSSVDGLARLFTDASFLKLYYSAFIALIDTVYNPQVMNPLIDQTLGGFVPQATRDAIKQFVVDRTAGVLAQVPRAFAITSTLPIVNTYHQTGSPTTSLAGTADVATTGSVLVGGVPAQWNARTGAWSIGSVPLNPGINRVLVETYSGQAGTGTRVEQGFIDVWYDNGSAAPTQFSIPMGSVWKYLDNGTDQGTGWRAAGFGDGAWASGPGQLGYGDGDESTTVGFIDTNPGLAGEQKNITTYFRHSFTIPAGQTATFTNVDITLLRDDGAVVYLNGTEIIRTDEMPGTLGDNTIAYNTPASTTSSENEVDTYTLTPAQRALLHDGVNVLAVEIHQQSETSSDVSFDLSLTATGASNGAGGTSVSGTLPAGVTTWTAANGPYSVTSTVVVPVGATLVIQPGTSVFFAAGTELTVNGRLDAQGAQYNQIRFTRTPGITGVWNGVQFANSVQDNRINYAVLEWASPTSNNGLVGVSGSQLLIENSTLDHAERRRIRALNSNVIIRNNTFADIFAPGVAPSTDNFSEHIWGGYGLPGGYFIIEGNSFGLAKGHNDVIDIDGGLRSAGDPVLQILNNTFYGGGDDAMDLEGDAHIEGNLIMNFVRDQWNTAQGNSNALSAGDAHVVGHEYYLARNTFLNVQDITTVKENSFVRFYNNTIINSLSGAISFNPPDDPVPGKGGVFEGNIFYNSPSPFKDFPALPADFIVRNNLLTADQVNLGTGNISGDPRLADVANLDFHLLPGSPALGAGPNGLDMGSQVAQWASISGEPPVNTAQTTATLTVGGPSIVAYKYKINGGAWSAETPIATPISLSGLANGAYTVYVVGRNDAGVWQADAQATASKTWTVNTAAAHLVLNEILAANQSAVDLNGTRPDAIELYNGGTSPIDLSDMSLTDNPLLPRKFVFPAGSTIAAGGYFVVYADILPSAPGELHTGFALSSTGGESVVLFNTLAAGGLQIDSVTFGVQAIDWSIGRVGQSRQWALAQPTFGAANVAARTGNPAMLKINEWFTNGQYIIQGDAKTNDFVELYNSDTLPVALGGLYLSDDPVGEPNKSQIPPLSFIGAFGVHPYSAFQADSQMGQGADHADFKLSSDRGWLLLSDSALEPIDRIFYGPQTSDYSQGRAPDGSATYQFFAQPSPAIDLTPPSVPTSLHTTASTATTVDLAWNASIDAQTGVLEYRLYRDGVLIATTSSTSFLGAALVNGADNVFRVSAVNGDNVESALSQPADSGVDTSPPTIPTGLAGDVMSQTQVDLSWSASSDPETGVSLYTIYRGGVEIGTSTTPSFSDTSAPAAGTISYQVSATNGDGFASPLSAVLQIVKLQQGVYPTAGYAGTIDSWISSTAATTNTGGSAVIAFDGANTAGGEDRGLIRWDLSAVTTGGTVTGASIIVNVTNNSGGQTYNLYALKRTWVEDQVTWNEYATGSAWQTAGGNGANDRDTVVLGAASASASGALTIELNAAGVAQVQQWIDTPVSNHGFVIIRSNSSVTDGMQISSRDAATLANRPQLAIAYASNTPVDNSPPSVPTGLAAGDNGASQISLSWNASTDAESGVSGYVVYRDGVQIGTPVTNSFVDTNVIPGKDYSYRVAAVNGSQLASSQSTAVVHQIAQPLTAYTLTLATRDSYLPGVPVLVQVEITGSDGKPAKDVWDAVASLSSNSPSVTLSTSEVRLRNGLGSVLVTFNGSGPFTLTASAGGIQTQRSLTSLSGVAQTDVSGTLVGAAVSWSGVIHVTGNVTVPVGTTLTVQPGTLVLIDGNSAPLSTDGKRIIVQGTINSLGTAAQPVTFTATDPAAPWGEIRHTSSQPSTYQYTQINRAGHTTGSGHTGTGPVMRVTSSTLSFDHVAITDLVGKVMEASGSSLTFNDSNLARATMGPEISTTGLLFQHGYITEMLGQYREDGINNDDDGIYIHAQSAGQTILIADSVVALVDDDAIDTLNSTITVDRVIVRDATNPNEDAKGISVNGGSTTVRNTLIANTTLGIATKNNTGGAASTTIDRTTIVDSGIGIEQADDIDIVVNVSNSIIRATGDAVLAEFPAAVTINYSNVNEAWPGTGNIDVDPLFVNVLKHDFHLAAGSPAIDTGDPAATLDADGTRADMGAFPRLQLASVAGRSVFYNNSKFDGNSAAAGAADDAAIASGKSALLPGGTATAANYTSYSRGLNGLMIDIAGLNVTPTAADFTFRVGNDNTPAGWAAAPAPTSISVRPGAGTLGSSRVTITWADGAIKNGWLQVTAKTSLGLAAADVFYFGNAVGETGNSAANAQVNSTDEIGARSNSKTFLNPALIGDNYDFNRDGFVNATDQIIARANSTTLAGAVKLISVPGSATSSLAVADSSALSTGVQLSRAVSPSNTSAAAAVPVAASPNAVSAATAADPGATAHQQAVCAWNADLLGHPATDSGLANDGDQTTDVDADLLELLASEQLLKPR